MSRLNLTLLPVLLGASWLVARPGGSTETDASTTKPSRLALVSRAVPWFVVGFVVVAGLRSAGLLDVPLPSGGTLADLCSTLAALLILVALAGVGMATDVRSLTAVGGRPFLLAAAMWVAIGLLGLLVATSVGAGPAAL